MDMLHPMAGVSLVAAVLFLAVLAGLGVPTDTDLFADFARFTVYIAPPVAAAVVALRKGR